MSSAILIGGTTPLGKELREQLEERGFSVELRLAGEEGQISAALRIEESEEAETEASVLTALEPEDLRSAKVMFLAGTKDESVRAVAFADTVGVRPLIIDLTYGLEDRPSARLRCPELEPGTEAFPPSTIHVLAHPAAVMIASVQARLARKFPIAAAVLNVFEPVSERGQNGMNELQGQTRSLFTFKGLDKAVFDAQVSFNMLPRYGTEATVSLQDIELRIERHLASLCAMTGTVPLPSLRLIQAPVFHGYSVSMWVEFEAAPTATQVAEALATAKIEVRATDLEPPTNVGAVGQSGMSVGIIEADRNNPRAMWLWAVADNFRVLVDEAIDVAQPAMQGGRA